MNMTGKAPLTASYTLVFMVQGKFYFILPKIILKLLFIYIFSGNVLGEKPYEVGTSPDCLQLC